RELLSDDGLKGFVMTTGSRGMHVVVPLDRTADFDAVRSYAMGIADEMVQMDDRLTMERSVTEREGRLLVDVFRNAYAQTGVAPYAVRARDGAPVAAPLRWEELDDPDLGPRSFNIRNVWEKASKDPWSDIDFRGGRLPEQ
ncbi:MAG TPA: ATP-dependent DNA ligase, partial [Methanomassiliicoccaceae archaeon]|nr:ATP-dependent DNA ligase [Methanomassiliicoccaceae archaeon]